MEKTLRRVRQNFLAKGRLTSSPPLPSPPTPSGAPTDRPNRYRERVYEWSVGAPEGVGRGWGGELANLPYANTSFSAAMLL